MYNKSVTKIGICRRQRRRPRRESNPYICDFSRGGLNARFKRSHPNLAPRPKILGLDSLRGLCFGWRWNCYLLLEGFEDAPEGYIFHCNCFLKD